METEISQVMGSDVRLEPLAGTRTGLATVESRLVKLGEQPKPSARQINDAIATLASLRTRQEQLVGAGAGKEVGGEIGEGDVVLGYDLTLRAQGADPFRVKGRQVLHGILTRYGRPDAAHDMETALLGIVRPLKTHALKLVAGVVMS